MKVSTKITRWLRSMTERTREPRERQKARHKDGQKKPHTEAGQDQEFTRQPKGTTLERKSEMEHDAPHNIHPTAERGGTPGKALLTDQRQSSLAAGGAFSDKVRA